MIRIPEEINNSFRDFNNNLYSTQSDPSCPAVEEFLNSIDLPKVNLRADHSPGFALTMAELHKAIQHMPNRKAPGPDGFPAEFYKELRTAKAPNFYRTVKDFKESGTLSPDINSANICLQLHL